MKRRKQYGLLTCRFGALKRDIEQAAADRNWTVARFLRFAIANQIARDYAAKSNRAQEVAASQTR